MSSTVKKLNNTRMNVVALIYANTGNEATSLPMIENTVWANLEELPYTLQEKLSEFNWSIPLQLWQRLHNLQRLALMKLSYPCHENKNFPRAMQEFG